MKKIAVSLFIILVAVAFLAPPLQAQQYQDPSRIPANFYYPATSSKTFAASQTDTLPQPTAAGVSTGYKLCASNLLSFVLAVNDSSQADIYVDHRPVGSATWTQTYVDSIIVTDTTSTSTGTKEIAVRTSAVDRLGKCTGEFRIRIAWRAAGIAVRDSKDLTYSVRLDWKP